MSELRPDPRRDPRGPWDVPEEPDPWRPVVTGGLDTDGDGVADTTVVDDGADLLVATDLDGDGVADQVLRLVADGTVHTVELPDTGPESPGWSPVPH
jgi:hypothetical protein